MSTLPCPAEDDEEKDLDGAHGDDKDDDDCQGVKQSKPGKSIIMCLI